LANRRNGLRLSLQDKPIRTFKRKRADGYSRKKKKKENKKTQAQKIIEKDAP